MTGLGVFIILYLTADMAIWKLSLLQAFHFHDGTNVHVATVWSSFIPVVYKTETLHNTVSRSVFPLHIDIDLMSNTWLGYLYCELPFFIFCLSVRTHTKDRRKNRLLSCMFFCSYLLLIPAIFLVLQLFSLSIRLRTLLSVIQLIVWSTKGRKKKKESHHQNVPNPEVIPSVCLFGLTNSPDHQAPTINFHNILYNFNTKAVKSGN